MDCILQTISDGYKLTSEHETYIMLPAKRGIAKYFLKKIAPQEQFISGMFYNSKRKEYRGRDLSGKRVVVRLGMTTATIDTS